jgi:hypothetical protein
LLGAGCGGQAARAREAHARSEAGGSPLERIVVAERPPLTLVARGGDPRPAMAFAASHARGSALSAALTGLLAARLESAGVTNVEARAHGLGLELARLLDAPAEAPLFLRAVRAALAKPVTGADPALGRARRELDALKALSFAGPGEAAAAACSGELGLPDGKAALDLGTPAGIAALEAARVAVFQVEAAAFSALGSEPILEAATRAVGSGEPWPDGSPDADPWPEKDVVFVDGASGTRRLTLALRLGDADAAIDAGLVLGARDSELLRHLEALSPPWRLERATAVARRRGACLRLDLAPPKGDPAPNALETARVAALVESAATRAIGRAETGALDESVLRPSDPRRAAALAAWRALPVSVESEAHRSVLAYQVEPAAHASSAELGAAFNAVRAQLSRPSFEITTRAEPGQGELWLLLASPCGTGAESVKDAGALALALRTLAARSFDASVSLEPWVSVDGVGLLAHAPRGAGDETPSDQATRVAQALGRAIALRVNGSELGASRAQLLDELGARPFAGWSLALEGLAGGHPSWLEPRGTWSSVSELSTEELERARRSLLGGPLRLAVLASRGEAQSAVAAQELETWLLPIRGELAACAENRAESPRRGEARYESLASRQAEGAYVGVVFNEAGPAAARAAELSEAVLNRPGGVLERALAACGAGTSARARALGGSRRPALVVEVRALPDKVDDAVARVRAALDQLAHGGLSAEDGSVAVRELTRAEASARFDPRRRIVEQWRGARPLELEPNALRPFAAALDRNSHWVVSEAKPQ